MHSVGNTEIHAARSVARWLAPITLVAGLLLTGCSRWPPEPPSVLDISGATMGTSWRLQWIEDASLRPMREPATVLLALEQELARINALMSTWDPASELSRFNASDSVEPVVLHEDTLKVIDTALKISRLTGGSYDISLQPVIELWGFADSTDKPTPHATDIARALDASGYRQLVRIGNTVRKRQPGLALDVSSLAKGYAVDKLGEVVESMGMDRYILDIGGEVRARGHRADGKPWRVGVESPDGAVGQVLELQDTHIASSGSYRNYRVENGRRLSHILDGNTGRPIEHDLVAVSVVHDSTMLADAWATALLVVGEVRATELVQKRNMAAQLTVVRDGQFQRISSEAFAALLVGE